MGLARPDVGIERAGPNAILSGFEYWVDLSAVSSSTFTARLQLVARSSEGGAVPLFERVVHRRVNEPETEQSDRESIVARRRERLLSAIAAPSTSELNLVVFTHRLDYGGGQLWLDELLKKAGAGTRFPCTLISYKDGPLRDPAEERGIAVHVTNEPPVDDVEGYEGRITELAALVAGGGHNVALVNTAPVFSGADVASRLSLPTVWAVHESFTPTVLMAVAFGSQIHPQLFGVARRAMSAAEALVFEAQATLDLYAPWARPGHSVVVPYGVDTRHILDYSGKVSRDAARADVGVRPDSRLILVMGTIEQRKAQTRIAQAFGRIADDHPEWSLVFVGDTKSPYSDALKSYVQTLGLGERCTVAPVDRDTYRWYRAADALLSASDVESLPRSMLEVMCFGVPVVSASVFGVPQLVRDGETGFLFEPNDLDALVSALRRVLALDASELEHVGKVGQSHALEHYDSSGYSEDILRLCQGLLDDPRATPDEILSTQGPRKGGLDPATAGSAEVPGARLGRGAAKG
jgi:glycosyltransferase involved in cell wall biosynthesis